MLSGIAARQTSPAQDRQTQRRPDALSDSERRVVQELQRRDREVRTHEAAHQAAGGSLVGGVSLSFQTGPDGRQYAIGGEVSIDSGPERDPQDTIAKMIRVIAAALAPAQPSAQDRAVATQARSTMNDAQRQLADEQRAAAERPPGGQIDLIA